MCGCGCNNNLSQLSFLGEQGISVVNITSAAGEGNDIVLTFHLSDGSTITDIVVPGGNNGSNGTNGENANAGCFIYQSACGNPFETIVSGYNTFATTDQTIAQLTLAGNGSVLDFYIDLSSTNYGLGSTVYTANVYIAGVSTGNITLSHSFAYITGSITRISATTIMYEIHCKNVASASTTHETVYSGFRTVADLDSNSFDLQLFVNNTSTGNVLLNKFLTKITIPV